MATRGLGTLTIDLILRTGGFVQGADKAERALQRSQEAMASFGREGERLAASVANPFELFTKSIQAYNTALKANKIELETYNRLVAQTTATLASANVTQQTLTKSELAFNAAIELATAGLQSGVYDLDFYNKEVARLKATLDIATKAEQEHAKAVAAAGKLAASAITPLEQYLAKLREIAAAKIAAPQLITPKVEQRLTGAARQEFLGTDPAIVGRTQKLADAMRNYNALVAEGRKLTKQFGTTAQQEYRDTFRALTRLALAGEITPEIRTAALKEAKADLDALNPEIQKMNALEAEAQRINQANIAPQEAHNAALRHLDLLLQETSLGVAAYNKEVAKEDAILKAATTSQTENNKAYADAKRLANSARTDLEKYLDAIREIQAAKLAAPELITPPVQARLVRGVEERFDPKTKQEIAQRQELDRILQANITTLERYQAELRVVNEAQKAGVGDANELAKAATRLQAAIDSETPALQKQKAAMEAAKATAASMQDPLQQIAARMAEIRAEALAFPTIVTPTIETAALKEQQARLDDLNGVTAENNRLNAEAARIKAANIGPQQTYNDTLALNAELVRRNQISQAEANAENAKAKALLDSQDAALQEHNRLMAEGAALTKSMRSAQEIHDAEVARANKLYATYDATLKRTAISQTDHARALARAKTALDQANNGVAKQSKGFFALRQDLLGINGLLIRFTSIYALVGAVRGVIKIVDDYKLLENRLSTVTNSTAQLVRVQNSLFEIAQRTRQAYSGVVDLYVRLAQAGKELGASQGNLLKFTEAVGNAFAISGTTSERARAALVQLSQGLATGTFRAEEFNSVNEASPALIRAVAQNLDRFKGSVGALRNAVRDGTLSSKEFFEGTLKASAKLAETVAGMPLTISQAFQQLKNTFDKVVSTADMGPLVDSIKEVTALIKDPKFQKDLATFVNLLLKLSGAGVEIGATIGRVLEELTDDVKLARTVWSDLTPGIELEGTLTDIDILQVQLRRLQDTVADKEKHKILFFFDNKEKLLKDIQDISDELAVLRNQAGTAFQLGESGFLGRGRYVRGAEQRVANLAVDKPDKEAEAAQKSILNLITSMEQQIAVTGETEEATIRYRIEFGDLVDEFKKAGPAFAKFKDELIRTAKALDQFKARKDIEKQTKALQAEVVELQAARIEEEQGAVAALKFRREHNVEMAKTIALARGETIALEKTVAAVKAIPPIKLKADTTEAKAAIEKVADLPTPTLKIDTSQAVGLVKQVTDPWEVMQKKLETAKLKVDTAQAEAALKKTKVTAGEVFGEFGTVKIQADTTQAVAAIDEVKKKTYAFTTQGVKFQPKIDTTAADVLLRKLEEINKQITVKVGVDTSALEKQRSEILKQLAALPPTQLKLVTAKAEAQVAEVKKKAAEPVTLQIDANVAAAQKALDDFRKNAKDPAGFPIDLTRPRVPVPGTDDVMTEFTTTEKIYDRWYNLPQVVKGVLVDVETAVKDATRRIDAGELIPNFATMEEADAKAGARSEAIGAAIAKEKELIAALEAAKAATRDYTAEVLLNNESLADAAKAQQGALNTVAAQVKSITDETTAFIQNKIAMEEGAAAALDYRIAQGDLKKIFDQVGGAEYAAVIKDLTAQIAAAGGYQKELNAQLAEAEKAYAKSKVAAANLAEQLRIVAAYQEKLAHAQSAAEASFKYIPDAAAAAREWALAIEGLTERFNKGEFSQEQFADAVKRANKDYKDAVKGLDELSVFAEQAAKNMQDSFAEFLYDPFSKGLDGMLEGLADTLRKMSAEIIAAKLFEKFNVEDMLKPGSLTTGPLTGWLKGVLGIGDQAPELQAINVPTARMPERTSGDIAAAEKRLADLQQQSSAALKGSAATLQTSSAALQTGATTLQTGATTLQTAAQALLTVGKTLGATPGAIAQPVATAVSDTFEEIIVSRERLPVGGVVPAVGASRAGMPAGASGLVEDPAEAARRNKELVADVFSIAAGVISPELAPLIELVQLLKIGFGGVAGGMGGFPGESLLGGAAAAAAPAGVVGAVGAAAAPAVAAVAGTAEATALVTAGTTVATALATAGTTAAAALTTAGTAMAAAITAAGTAAAAAIAAAGAGSAVVGGLSSIPLAGFNFSGIGFAGGGKVTGPAGVDKVPLWATAGEFMVKAPAVRQPGVEQLLRLVNSLPGLAGGGLLGGFLGRAGGMTMSRILGLGGLGSLFGGGGGGGGFGGLGGLLGGTLGKTSPLGGLDDDEWEKLLAKLTGRFAAGGLVEAPAVAQARRAASTSTETLKRTLDAQTKRTAVEEVRRTVEHRIERLLNTAAPIVVDLRADETPKFGEHRRSADELEHLLARLGLLRLAGGGPTDIRMGGMLQGPGTPTSDSLLLLGSTKEFMVQARAAQQPGARDFLAAFNRGQIRMEEIQLGLEALKHLPHRAMGGALSSGVLPAFANGGSMPEMNTVSTDNRKSTVVIHQTINSPNGQVSRATELQVAAGAARGARSADRRNN